MTEDDLKRIENGFYTYSDFFVERSGDPKAHRLKQAHTARVCENIKVLADSIGLDATGRNMAQATAWLHDVGRFPQFEVYGTFSDPLSKNHAALSVGVILRQNFLEGISRRERKLVLRSVALHNRPCLPEKLDPRLSLLAKLLRDADKLDIYKVMMAHYRSAETGETSFITHDMADDGRVSVELAGEIMRGKGFHYSRIATLNDMKLFQVGMIYDLNFPASFSAIRDREVVPVILGSMPPFPESESLSRIIATYVNQKSLL
ncbi:MAG: HD domain-containing protein [Desulfobacterales bacterium]|nr:HD domain-containing protein [Desulfobacterales bacterium]